MATDVDVDVRDLRRLEVKPVAPFGVVIKNLGRELAASTLNGVMDLEKAVEGFLFKNARILSIEQKGILVQVRNYAEVVGKFQVARKLNDKDRLQKAIESGVDFQQRLATMILENTVISFGGITFRNNIDELFELLFETARKFEDRGFLVGEEGYISGCRAMVSACLTLRMCGWEVKMPNEDWDRFYDIDLISISPAGRRYGVDVTSGQGEVYLDENKRKPKGAALDGIIVLQVPKLSSKRSGRYFVTNLRQRILGVPSREALASIKASLSGRAEED